MRVSGHEDTKAQKKYKSYATKNAASFAPLAKNVSL